MRGKIALHDSRLCPGKGHTDNTGPVRLVSEVVFKDDCFELIEEVDTMTVFKKAKDMRYRSVRELSRE